MPNKKTVELTVNVDFEAGTIEVVNNTKSQPQPKPQPKRIPEELVGRWPINPLDFWRYDAGKNCYTVDRTPCSVAAVYQMCLIEGNRWLAENGGWVGRDYETIEEVDAAIKKVLADCAPVLNSCELLNEVKQWPINPLDGWEYHKDGFRLRASPRMTHTLRSAVAFCSDAASKWMDTNDYMSAFGSKKFTHFNRDMKTIAAQQLLKHDALLREVAKWPKNPLNGYAATVRGFEYGSNGFYTYEQARNLCKSSGYQWLRENAPNILVEPGMLFSEISQLMRQYWVKDGPNEYIDEVKQWPKNLYFEVTWNPSEKQFFTKLGKSFQLHEAKAYLAGAALGYLWNKAAKLPSSIEWSAICEFMREHGKRERNA